MAKLSLCVASALVVAGATLPVAPLEGSSPAEEQRKRDLFLQAREANRKEARGNPRILPDFLKMPRNAPPHAVYPVKGLALPPPSQGSYASAPARPSAPLPPPEPPVNDAGGRGQAEAETEKKGPIARLAGLFRPKNTPPVAESAVSAPPTTPSTPAAAVARTPTPSRAPKVEVAASTPAPVVPAPRTPSRAVAAPPPAPAKPAVATASNPSPPKAASTGPALAITAAAPLNPQPPSPPAPAASAPAKPAISNPDAPDASPAAVPAAPRETVAAARTSVMPPITRESPAPPPIVPDLTAQPPAPPPADPAPETARAPVATAAPHPESLESPKWEPAGPASSAPQAPAAKSESSKTNEAGAADLAQIRITADNEAEFDLETSSLVFVGHAVMEAPGYKVEGDRITVRVTDSGDGITSAQVVGSVKVTIASRGTADAVIGQSAKAEFDPGAGSFTLLGWPEVSTGGKREIAADAGTKIILHTDGRVDTIGATQPGIAGR